MNKLRKTYLFISIAVFVLGQLLTHFYRPFIYKNQVNDLGFADTIGSLVAVISACFFIWSLKSFTPKEKNKHILIVTFIYSVLWESMGIIGLHGTFDYKDIIAGCISGVITYYLKECIDRKSIKANSVDGKLIQH